jgi:hypothetical protein
MIMDLRKTDPQGDVAQPKFKDFFSLVSPWMVAIAGFIPSAQNIAENFGACCYRECVQVR